MKLFKLVIIAFSIVMLGYGLRVIWDLAHSITWHEFITPVKRGFYSACIAAIFFYTACAIRAVAKYYEARARAISEDEAA